MNNNKFNSMTKGTFWFALSYLLQKAISIFSTPVFTRLFTTEEYGTYSMYSTWLSIILVISTFNISGPVYNTLSHKYSDEQDGLWTNTLCVEIGTVLFAFSVFFVFEYFFGILSGIDLTLLILIFFNVISNIMSSLWLSKSKYQNDYLIPSIATIIQSLLSFGLAVAFSFIFKNKVYGRIIGSIIPMAVLSIFASFFFFKKGKFQPNWRMIKNIFLLSLPLVFHYLAQDALGQGDRIFLEEFYGKTEVAVYSLSYSLAFLPLVFVQAINATFAPWKFRKIEKKDNLSMRKMIPIFAVVVFSVTFLLVLIGPEVITIFGGENYSVGAQLMPILGSSVMAVFFYDIYSTSEFYYERTLIASLITFVAAALNIGLNALIIPNYGSVGASFATFISYVFMALAHFVSSKIILYKKNNNLDYYNDRFMIIFTFFSILIIGLLYFLYDYTIVRLVIFGAYLVIGIVIVFINKKKLLDIVKNRNKEDL